MPRLRTKSIVCQHGCSRIPIEAIYNLTEDRVDDVILPFECPHKNECWVDGAMAVEISIAEDDA